MVAFLIDDMLQSLSHEGFTSAELKAAVIDTLAPYFENTTFLEQNVLDSQLLSMFGYFIAYRGNTIFESGINEILHLYRSARDKDKKLLWSIILSTKDEYANIENLMWNVKNSTPYSVPDDCYDATMMYMRHIGDTLELGAKNEINELYAIIKIVNNENADYEVICKTSFGVNVNNILSKNHLTQVLKTSPNNLKLSDWRNIAYHHTYLVQGEKILCHYGKSNASFSLSIDELREYAAKIITSCNILDIGRRIFLFDNIESLSDEMPEQFESTDRVPMKLGQLNTTLLTQGFTIVDSKITSGVSEIVVKDLNNDGSLTADQIKRRKIHATQFLYPLWAKIPNALIKVSYCDCTGDIKLTVSTSDKICKKISTGEETLSYLALHFIIEQENI